MRGRRKGALRMCRTHVLSADDRAQVAHGGADEGGAEREYAPGAFHHRRVDHLPVDRHDSAGRTLEGFYYPAGTSHLFGAGRERIMDRIELTGVDSQLSREAVVPVPTTFQSQTLQVAHVGPDRVDRLHIGRGGRGHQHGAGEVEFVTLGGAPCAQREGQVLSTQTDSAHSGPSGQVGRVQHTLGSLDQGRDQDGSHFDAGCGLCLAQRAVQRLQLRRGLCLWQHDPTQAG